MQSLPRKLDIFKEIDTLIDKNIEHNWSLSPNKKYSTSFYALAMQGQVLCQDYEVWELFGEYLSHIVGNILEYYPENIFWDFDYYVGSTISAAVQHSNKKDYIADVGKQTLAILKLFGNKTNIKFRYIHDFIYGFDWAKWIKKNPQSRQFVQVFEPTFLKYMYKRGQELLLLIEKNDDKYHRLDKKTNSYRNPFGFSRNPQEEILLLSTLAQKEEIPVKAWLFETNPRWDYLFSENRLKRSRELGINSKQVDSKE